MVGILRERKIWGRKYGDLKRYRTEVNKDGTPVTMLEVMLNKRWEEGWRLAHIFEQGGNTVTVFERRD